MPTDAESSIAHFHRVLALKPIGPDRFEAVTEQERGRLFGGLVLAQSIMAAGESVTSGSIHSMHAYFLRAGRPAMPIEYAVGRIRDGRNFTGRRVSAYQQGEAGLDMIFEASISFVTPEDGASFQEPMPEADGPEGMAPWWTEMAPPPDAPVRDRFRGPDRNPIEIVSGEEGGSRRTLEERLPHRKVWGRPAAPLGDDREIVHAAALAYFSDSGIVATVARVIDSMRPGGATASLDHAIWFHHPPRFDGWVLYTTDSPIAHAARGLTWGSMYNTDGVRIASVAQEGFYRRPKPSTEAVS